MAAPAGRRTGAVVVARAGLRARLMAGDLCQTAAFKRLTRDDTHRGQKNFAIFAVGNQEHPKDGERGSERRRLGGAPTTAKRVAGSSGAFEARKASV